MRWQLGRRSDNVEDARGRGGAGLGGLSAGGIVVALIASYVLGVDPMQMLGIMTQLQGDLPVDSRNEAPPANDPGADFVRAILGETEDVWGAIFEQAGNTYERPKLSLFTGGVRSACGTASSAMGPFYCPRDHHVYLDRSFFQEMRAHLGGGGDFADAYVIAHEVGHHVQNLLGNFARAQRGGERGAEGSSVRFELQADCFAGVWGYHAQQRHQWLESGDVEQALSTATAIGDDRLQQQSQGTVVPDSFTHGTSRQRVRWFRAGFESGDMNRCDTFGARSLD